MVAKVANVYNNLPPPVRAKTAIFGQNYGQGGAVDLFGSKYGLPKASAATRIASFGGHAITPSKALSLCRVSKGNLKNRMPVWRRSPQSITLYSMPYEHFEVFYCRNLKMAAQGCLAES